MSTRDLLNAQLGSVEDGFLIDQTFQIQSLPFFNKGFRRFAPHQQIYETIDPETDIDQLDRDVRFKLNTSIGNVLGNTWLLFDRGAVTFTGVPTTLRLVRNWAYRMIKSVTIRQGTNVLQIKSPEHWEVEHRFVKNDYLRNVLKQMAGTDRSDAESTAATILPEVVRVPLKLWYEEHHTKFLKIFDIAGDIIIDITFNPLSSILAHDATTVAMVVNRVRLEVRSIHILPKERELHIKSTENTNRLSYRIIDKETQTTSIASGATSVNIKINDFINPCNALVFWITPDASLAPGTALNYQDFVQILDAQLLDGTIIQTRRYTDSFLRYVLAPNFAPGEATLEFMYILPFGSDIFNSEVAGGHITWANMTNPTLTINFPAALVGAHTAHLVAVENNFITHQGFRLKREFR